MEVVKKKDDLTIVKKRSGRYGVRKSNGQWLNGADKVAVLLAEGLITAPAPKAEPEPEVEAEAPAEEASTEAEPAEEAPAE